MLGSLPPRSLMIRSNSDSWAWLSLYSWVILLAEAGAGAPCTDMKQTVLHSLCLYWIEVLKCKFKNNQRADIP